MDTIFALATARGKAGVAVIRMSGPMVSAVVQLLAGDLPTPRRASLRRLRWEGSVLDDALVIRFERDASFTGEESAEFQVHGGRATVQAVLQALGEIPGMRMADAGEFTRRALENGRLDLSQVEGLADLVEAETEMQRRQALRVMEGGLRDRVSGWREALVRAGALLEATIDFVEEDVPVDVYPEVLSLLTEVSGGIEREITNSRGAERVRDGFEVAIIGAPNAGKSTLLNHLAGRDAAITSSIAGTTRDIIEVRMDIGGFAVTLLDTAGLRETDDIIEREGVLRTVRRAEAADLRIFLLDAEDLPMIVVPREGDIVLHGKADLRPAAESSDGRFSVSGKNGFGVDRLLEEIAVRLRDMAPPEGLLIRERHRAAMTLARDALSFALSGIGAGSGAELVAADLRRATRALAGIVGIVDVESLLDEIFSSFCIGK